MLGGRLFGRRATPNADYFAEIGGDRQGERRQGAGASGLDARGRHQGRPLSPDGPSPHPCRAGCAGSIIGWEQQIVGQSFIIGSPFEAMIVKDGIDATVVEGAADMPYAFRTSRWSGITSARRSPCCGGVRSVTPTPRYVDRGDDRHAGACGRPGPGGVPARAARRSIRVIAACSKLAAEKAGWGEPLPAGRGRGIAVHEIFGTFVAMMADVSVARTARSRSTAWSRRSTAALPVNPDVIRAQVEGGIGYGLGAALRSQITLKDGVVEQSNFDGYPAAAHHRHAEGRGAHHAVAAAPTGIGEPGVPPLAPARVECDLRRRPASGCIRCRGTSRR